MDYSVLPVPTSKGFGKLSFREKIFKRKKLQLLSTGTGMFPVRERSVHGTAGESTNLRM